MVVGEAHMKDEEHFAKAYNKTIAMIGPTCPEDELKARFFFHLRQDLGKYPPFSTIQAASLYFSSLKPSRDLSREIENLLS
jgi:hypothetical protein